MKKKKFRGHLSRSLKGRMVRIMLIILSTLFICTLISVGILIVLSPGET